jgi:hypothetical protein
VNTNRSYLALKSQLYALILAGFLTLPTVGVPTETDIVPLQYPRGQVLHHATQFFKGYHDYQVRPYDQTGFDKKIEEIIPATGPGLILMHHPLVPYESLMLTERIYEKTSRLVVILVDDNFFKVPLLGKWLNSVSIMAASSQNIKDLLKEGKIILLYPGGTAEAIRNSEQRHQIHWTPEIGNLIKSPRAGIIKYLKEFQEENPNQPLVPYYLSACPNHDYSFEVMAGKLHSITRFLYKKTKVPLIFVKGRIPFPLFMFNVPYKTRLVSGIQGPFHFNRDGLDILNSEEKEKKKKEIREAQLVEAKERLEKLILFMKMTFPVDRRESAGFRPLQNLVSQSLIMLYQRLLDFIRYYVGLKPSGYLQK